MFVLWYNSFVKKITKEFFEMANRFVLNETSYHGKGAIKAIATEI